MMVARPIRAAGQGSFRYPGFQSLDDETFTAQGGVAPGSDTGGDGGYDGGWEDTPPPDGGTDDEGAAPSDPSWSEMTNDQIVDNGFRNARLTSGIFSGSSDPTLEPTALGSAMSLGSLAMGGPGFAGTVAKGLVGAANRDAMEELARRDNRVDPRGSFQDLSTTLGWEGPSAFAPNSASRGTPSTTLNQPSALNQVRNATLSPIRGIFSTNVDRLRAAGTLRPSTFGQDGRSRDVGRIGDYYGPTMSVGDGRSVPAYDSFKQGFDRIFGGPSKETPSFTETPNGSASSPASGFDSAKGTTAQRGANNSGYGSGSGGQNESDRGGYSEPDPGPDGSYGW